MLNQVLAELERDGITTGFDLTGVPACNALDYGDTCTYLAVTGYSRCVHHLQAI